MVSSSLENIAYMPELFVNRCQEIKLVEHMAQDLIQGKINQAGIAVFDGVRGIGKTWLVTHFQEVVIPTIPGATSLLFSLFPTPKEYNQQNKEFNELIDPEEHDFEKIIRVIVERVAKHVGTDIAANVALRELTFWLARDVERRFIDREGKANDQDSILVLILDSVFEADWNLLAQLERNLLTPLAALPRVMIIMTGRGRPYPWESPYLKSLYSPSEDEYEGLVPFTPQFTRQQLEKLEAFNPHVRALDEERIQEIEVLGGGLPLITALLAQATDVKEVLDDMAEILLEFIPQQEDRKTTRQYFEALSVLDGFREAEIAPMLAAYFNDQDFPSWSIKRIRQEIRDRLQKTHLIRWKDHKFVMDQSIQVVLMNFLRVNQPETWQRLHCQAYQLYNQWAQENRRYRDFYLERANFHAEALLAEGYNLDRTG